MCEPVTAMHLFRSSLISLIRAFYLPHIDLTNILWNLYLSFSSSLCPSFPSFLSFFEIFNWRKIALQRHVGFFFLPPRPPHISIYAKVKDVVFFKLYIPTVHCLCISLYKSISFFVFITWNFAIIGFVCCLFSIKIL